MQEKIEQYLEDLKNLAEYEKRAVKSLDSVKDLPRWKSSEYETTYLPALRLTGIVDKEAISLQNAADLHMHTEWSDGDKLDRVLAVAAEKGLDAIAITDHDCIEGALEARRRVHERRLKFAVVPGVEVSSRDGHIGALFVTKNIPKGLSAKETIRLIHEAGGIAVAHHPFVPSILEKILRAQLGCGYLIKELPFDAIECTNAVPGYALNYNRQAVEEMQKNHIKVAVTGSSDAHMARLVGMGRTYYSGNEGILSLYKNLKFGCSLGAEQYWKTKDKILYYLKLINAIIRNLLNKNESVN